MNEEKLSVFPMGKKNEAFAKYFTGQSYLDMLTTSGITVKTDMELIKELGYEARLCDE